MPATNNSVYVRMRGTTQWLSSTTLGSCWRMPVPRNLPPRVLMNVTVSEKEGSGGATGRISSSSSSSSKVSELINSLSRGCDGSHTFSDFLTSTPYLSLLPVHRHFFLIKLSLSLSALARPTRSTQPPARTWSPPHRTAAPREAFILHPSK